MDTTGVLSINRHGYHGTLLNAVKLNLVLSIGQYALMDGFLYNCKLCFYGSEKRFRTAQKRLNLTPVFLDRKF